MMRARTAILYPERQTRNSASGHFSIRGLFNGAASAAKVAPLSYEKWAGCSASERCKRLLELAETRAERLQVALQVVEGGLAGTTGDSENAQQTTRVASHLLRGCCVALQGVENRWRSAAMAAAAIAMTGQPVQVIHTTQSDANEAWGVAESLYKTLDVTAALLEPGMSRGQRKASYAAGVVHVSISELMLDYLRDRSLQGAHEGEQTRRVKHCLSTRAGANALILPGLTSAIIVDGRRLLCEASMTSVVASDRMELDESEMLVYALAGIAGQLKEDLDYRQEHGQITLTREGQQRLLWLGDTLPLALRQSVSLEQQILQALTAFRQFQPEQDYRLEEEQVVLLKAVPTGMDREVLMAFLYVREGYRPRDAIATAGRLNYRRFLQRYQYLSALADHVDDIQSELEHHYGLSVVAGTRRVSLWPKRICHSMDEAVEALLQDIRDLQADGQRVLLYAGRNADESLPLLAALDESGMAFDELEASNRCPSTVELCVLTGDTTRLERLLETGFNGWRLCSVLPLRLSDNHWVAAMDARPLSLLSRAEQTVLRHLFRANHGPQRLSGLLVGRALKKGAQEQHKLRCSMMAADEHYRHMLSFTGVSE